MTSLLRRRPGGAGAHQGRCCARSPGMTRDAGFAHTAELSARLFASAEAAAGMLAFLSRQPAPWVVAGA